jgi:hypothetical protein
MKTSEQFKKLLAIEASFTKGGPQIVAPHRVLVHEGPATDMSNPEKKKKIQLFLFNDCLIFAKLTMLGKYKFKEEAPSKTSAI